VTSTDEAGADPGAGIVRLCAVGPSLATWNDYLEVSGEMVGVRFARSDATVATVLTAQPTRGFTGHEMIGSGARQHERARLRPDARALHLRRSAAAAFCA
jgi:hypothetical protein